MQATALHQVHLLQMVRLAVAATDAPVLAWWACLPHARNVAWSRAMVTARFTDWLSLARRLRVAFLVLGRLERHCCVKGGKFHLKLNAGLRS